MSAPDVYEEIAKENARTGGAAFPLSPGDVLHYQAGMTLRDWFAGQALAGWLASFGPTDGYPDARAMALLAYAQADAMLLQRAQAGAA